MRRFLAPSSGLDRFFVAQFSAGYTTNISGFDFDRHRVAEQIELTCIAVRMTVSGRRARHGHFPDSRRESPMLRLNPAISMVRQKPTSHPAAALPRR
jgi:hypothetical protein